MAPHAVYANSASTLRSPGNTGCCRHTPWQRWPRLWGQWCGGSVCSNSHRPDRRSRAPFTACLARLTSWAQAPQGSSQALQAQNAPLTVKGTVVEPGMAYPRPGGGFRPDGGQLRPHHLCCLKGVWQAGQTPFLQASPWRPAEEGHLPGLHWTGGMDSCYEGCLPVDDPPPSCEKLPTGWAGTVNRQAQVRMWGQPQGAQTPPSLSRAFWQLKVQYGVWVCVCLSLALEIHVG